MKINGTTFSLDKQEYGGLTVSQTDIPEECLYLNKDEIIPLALALLREAGAEAITEIGINDTVIIIQGEK